MENFFYLAQVFGIINSVCRAMLAVGIIFSIVCIIFIMTSNLTDEYDFRPNTIKSIKRSSKWSIAITIVSFLLCTFVPSKQTYLLMVGGKVVDEAISKNPEIKELPDNTLELLNEYIKTTTEDIKNRKEK